MIGALAALLLSAQAGLPAPVPFALEQFMTRSAGLDGRWVEFDAYVILMRRSGGPLTLSALTGETRDLPGGRRLTMCADEPEASVAVLLGRNGLGPLSRRAARPLNAYVGVRIRGILRGRSYGFRVGPFEHEWVGSVDHARIVRVTGRRCLLDSAHVR
jgi:hypothetical protein